MTTGTLAGPPVVTAGRARPRQRTRPTHAAAIPLRRTAWVVFGLQFVVMAVWSEVQFSRFSLTTDAATYIQAFHLISHGDLNPFETTKNYPFLRDHFQLTAWPLSLLDRVGPQGLSMLWAQDLFVVLGEAAGFAWMRHIVAKRPVREGSALNPTVVLGTGLLLLVANPWNYWTIADDIHIEPFALVFVILAAFDFSRGKHRRAWIWVALTLCSGDVAATWVAGLGVSALLAARFNRGEPRTPYRLGLALIGTALAWTAFAGVLGANKGSGLVATYGFLAVSAGTAAPRHMTAVRLLKGVAQHPANVVNALWRGRANIYSRIAPTGFVGAFSPWTFGVPALVLLENNLLKKGQVLFSFAPFQNLPVGVFTAVGAIVLLVWAGTRFHLPRWFGTVIVIALVTNAVFWAAIWIPAAVPNWLRVSGVQANVLSDALRQIPNGAEVVVSQGVAGRFAQRKDMRLLSDHDPVSGTSVWFVIAPNAGIETQKVDEAIGIITQLAGPMNAQLVEHGAGVWVFRWHRPASVHNVRFTNHPRVLATWALGSAVGNVDLTGPAPSWHVSSKPGAGYLVYGDYWPEPLGQYVATASLSTTTPVNVEVWNETANQLLGRRALSSTNGRVTISIPFDYSRAVRVRGSFAGFGPFVAERELPPTTFDELEVRVWSPAGGHTAVYNVGLTAAAG